MKKRWKEFRISSRFVFFKDLVKVPIASDVLVVIESKPDGYKYAYVCEDDPWFNIDLVDDDIFLIRKMGVDENKAHDLVYKIDTQAKKHFLTYAPK